MKPQIVNTRMHGLVKKSRVIKAALFVITMLMVVTMALFSMFVTMALL